MVISSESSSTCLPYSRDGRGSFVVPLLFLSKDERVPLSGDIAYVTPIRGLTLGFKLKLRLRCMSQLNTSRTIGIVFQVSVFSNDRG